MKPIILSLLFISFIFLPACRGKQEQTPVPGGAGDGKVKYSKDIKPLDYKPDQFKTYTLTPPAALTPASLKEQSQRIFNITGVKNVPFIPDTARSPFSQYLSLRRADDPSGVFEMHRQTGRIVFNRGLKAYKTDLATPGLPSDDDAIKRTQALIEQLQLGVDARELTKPDVTFLEMSAVKDNEPSQTFRKMVTVRYDRMLDGLRVEGGTRLIFSFGRDAELTSMIWDWGKWEPRQVAAEAVIDAREQTRQIEETLIRDAGIVKQISVEKRDLVLYNDGQGHIEPAVYVSARITQTRKGPDGKDVDFSYPYDFYAPILRQPGAMFPQMKDQQLRVRPLPFQQMKHDSIVRNRARRTKDE